MLKFKTGVLVLCALIVSTFSFQAYAEILWLDGGLLGAKQVSGTYEYQEMCFITGEPVMLKGLVTLPKVDKTADAYQEKYAFELSNADKNIVLSRTVTFDVVKENSGALSQTRYKRTLKDYQETITTAGGTYTLAEQVFTDSRLYDNTLAVSYYNGNINASRKYYKNGGFAANEGFVTYDIETIPVVGYNHQWGNSETQKIAYTIKSYEPNEDYDPQKVGSDQFKVVWDGNVEVGMSSTRRVVFDYQYTNPQNISFRGSYHKVTRAENVLTYDYTLPHVKDGAIDTAKKGRNIGSKSLSNDVLLETVPLIAPRIRDIKGHWAEEDITLLTSLELFAIDKEYFVPTAFISRRDFAKAMVGAVHGKLPPSTKTDEIRRLRPGVETPYLDVLPTDPDYNYMTFVKENEVMYGKNGYFKGDETLTRAEAIAIMIRALGIQYLAPAPPYKTQFVDDAQIPEWAKDHIYMANEIGLVTGTPEGYINPNALVTKAEAAKMLTDFINHLKDVINYDYREKILAQ
ncbi:S-layer homology domain-containing protein [Fusibacter sp. JL298sf-3]